MCTSSDLSELDIMFRRIGRAACTLITKAEPAIITSESNNTPSAVAVCIFKMAKRVIAAAAESHAAPRISVNAKMKMLHALLVAVAKAVGMRIKNECKNLGFGPWVVLVQNFRFMCICHCFGAHVWHHPLFFRR